MNKVITCYFSQSSRTSLHSLVNRGANGGIAGNDVRITCKDPSKTVNVRGIDNHEITSMHLVTAGGVTLSTSGEVILIVHQCAYHPKTKTIHSSAQIDHFKNIVDDRAIKFGGTQQITTLDN